MSRILLLLDQKENQQLLASELSRDHEVRTADGDQDLDGDYDLLVLDGRALDRAFQRVHERRQAERPLYLPVLLVTSGPNVKMITRHLWRSVDELIITPIEREELRARIQVLLRVRAQSLALRERADTAERALASRDEIMQMVSHDLRSPLNVVLSHASLLLDMGTGLEPRQKDQLRTIHRAVNQMTLLTQDLLDASALESGTIHIEPAPEDPADLVRSACGQHQPAAESGHISLSWEVDDGLPMVSADRRRMDQLFGNLLSNAIRFTPESGSIVVRGTASDGGVRFSVSDTGPGLEPGDADHVFERFWHGTASPSSGTGLGLTIARGIVEAHGGRIGVDRAPDGGAEFWFEIPAARP